MDELRVEPEQRDTHDSPRLRTKKTAGFQNVEKNECDFLEISIRLERNWGSEMRAAYFGGG